MPQITSCPQCQRKLRVPDNLIGRKVKCPGCSINFTASVHAPPAPVEEVYPDPPPPPPRRGAPPAHPQQYAPPPPYTSTPPPAYSEPLQPEYDDPKAAKKAAARRAWIGARTGLIVLDVAMPIFALANLMYIICALIALNAIKGGMGGRGVGMGSTEDIIKLLSLIAFILMILWRLTSIVAYIFLLKTPSRAGLGGLVVAVLILAGTAPVILLLGYVINLATNAPVMLEQFNPVIAGNYILFILGGMHGSEIMWIIFLMLYVGLMIGEMCCLLMYYSRASDAVRGGSLSSQATFQMLLGLALAGAEILRGIGIWVVIKIAIGAKSISMIEIASNVWYGCGILVLVAALGWTVWFVVNTFLLFAAVNGHINKDTRRFAEDPI